MKNTVAVATHSQEATHSQFAVALMHITFRLSLILTVGVVGLIGLWAVATMVGAIASEGPLSLFTGWFSAITGS